MDDTVSTGNCLRKVKEKLKNKNGYNIKYLAVYATEESKELVDIYLSVLNHRRLFQWNYLNHVLANYSLYDLDGLLCYDPCEEENDDGEKYLHFLKNAKPLFIPKYKIKGIVTARLEKYRSETEYWLKKHKVIYEKLYMLDLPDKKTRLKKNCHAKFKSQIYLNSDASYFYESNRNQAYQIYVETKKPVFCTSTDEIFC